MAGTEQMEVRCAYCRRKLFDAEAGASGNINVLCSRCKEPNRVSLR